MRACIDCGEIKQLTEYGKYSRYPDGLHRKCKACTALYARRWRQNNPDLRDQAVSRRAEKLRQEAAVRKEARAAARAANAEVADRERKERARARARAAYAANPQKFRDKNKRIREAVPGRGAEWKRRTREKYRESIPHLLTQRMRGRFHKVLTRRKAGRSWREFVDYSVEELVAHLERQFLKGMSWENMGEWHIDHIVPLAAFTITGADDPELRRAWALTNLRPIWAKENLRKGARVASLL